MSIHAIVTEICYISNHWNFISNHWTSLYLLLFKKNPCTDRGLTDSQKSEKEKNIGNTIIRRYPSYTDQLMQVGIPDNQKGTTAGDLYDINYDFNYVITCWAQAVIYSNLVIFYNIDYVINYDIDFWPIRHHIRHLSYKGKNLSHKGSWCDLDNARICHIRRKIDCRNCMLCNAFLWLQQARFLLSLSTINYICLISGTL